AVKSRDEGKMVEIDPALYAFDFPVPSFYEYDPWDKEDQENAQKITPAPVEESAAEEAATEEKPAT
ncbi:MAG: hypothetical protein KAH38_03715, partial [Candidatus Hydrogenedentes bacterium]|nr:hypothetical protein [Candidatus Hydrogenedentota bacterium]